MKRAVFAAADNKWIAKLCRRFGMRMGVSRFVASETLAGAARKVQSLNDDGLMVTLDFLGESVTDRRQAADATDTVLSTLEAIRQHNLNANVSIKLSMLGLTIDPLFCMRNVDRIAALAKQYGNFVRIDMEDSSVTDMTLDLFKTMYAKYGKAHIGVVIQSYLYRTAADQKELERLGANVRIVKGAYKEPSSIAYPDKKDVDASYLKLVKRHMLSGAYTAVATHDETIITEIKRFAEKMGITKERFEFQMLYGIAGALQRRLASEGYRVRVYTPYGEMWYPYFTRRIAERPANLWFVIRGMFRR
jgi:proline dehydrogenase